MPAGVFSIRVFSYELAAQGSVGLVALSLMVTSAFLYLRGRRLGWW